MKNRNKSIRSSSSSWKSKNNNTSYLFKKKKCRNKSFCNRIRTTNHYKKKWNIWGKYV